LQENLEREKRYGWSNTVDADSTKISASSIPTLEELYNFLYDNPTIVIEISGRDAA
jgi:hypothetical protein